jgi:hypothetical protein
VRLAHHHHDHGAWTQDLSEALSKRIDTSYAQWVPSAVGTYRRLPSAAIDDASTRSRSEAKGAGSRFHPSSASQPGRCGRSTARSIPGCVARTLKARAGGSALCSRAVHAAAVRPPSAGA